MTASDPRRTLRINPMARKIRNLSVAMALVIGLAACTETRDLSGDSLWVPKCIYFLDGQYQACYGPGWNAYSPRDKDRYDFYEVEVGKKLDGSESWLEGSAVLFSERYSFENIDQRIINQRENELLEIDESNRSVTFFIDGKHIYFRLDSQN